MKRNVDHHELHGEELRLAFERELQRYLGAPEPELRARKLLAVSAREENERTQEGRHERGDV